MTKEKKITRATLKKFIKMFENNLYVKQTSAFDGMTDCVQEVFSDFTKVEKIDLENRYTFGIKGLWLVGQSRDLILLYR